MRRAPIAIAATVAGLAAVLGYHTHPRPAASLTARAPAASTAAPTRSTKTRKVTKPRRVAGTDATNQYGDVQVRVTAAGGHITEVTALRLPTGDGRSQQISSFAGPQLAQQAIAAQSANIDGVSGATYTSDSYRTSLQSAIDQLPSTKGSLASG